MRCGRKRPIRRCGGAAEKAFARRASKYSWMRQATPLPPPSARTLIKSPGVPGTAPLVRAARSRGDRRARRARARVAPCRQRVRRGDRDQRQDDDDRVDRPHPPRGRAAGRRSPATSASPPTLARRPVAAGRRHRRLRGLVVPARGHAWRSAPEAAVLLNLTPDHLDRYGGYEDYVAAKLRDLRQPGRLRPVAVAPDDLGIARPRRLRRGDCSSAPARRRRRSRSARRTVVGRSAAAGRRRDLAARRAQLARTRWPPPPLCLARGIDPEAVAAGLRDFAGVAHRLERIARAGRSRLVNDSKATNVASTIVALRRRTGTASI